jgi:hypothetical protein
MRITLTRTVLLKWAIVSSLASALCELWPAQAQPDAVGEWSPVVSWPVVAIHTHLLPNGKVLVWPRDGGNQAKIWDPATITFTAVPLSTMNVFCAGHAFLPDGRLLVTGGHISDNYGEKGTHVFDYRNNSWTRVDDMNDGRWYPTSTALANGDSLVVSGNAQNQINPLPQVWQAAGGWRNLSSANLALPLYPFMHVAPNGKVFNSGPNTTTRYLDTSGSGAWTTVALRNIYRDYGSSVQYDDGKIVLIGGGDPPTATAELIDLNQSSPSWRSAGTMTVARRQMNATLLPDGKIFVSGGTSGLGFNDACDAVFGAEMWDPAQEKFTAMASAAERRIYHSTALLLLDGRVLNGGGGQPADTHCADTNHSNIQIYSPPYLFKGARPAISSAPLNVTYGQNFFVGTPDSSAITRVNWLRLGSVTHSFNQNQRINRWSFSQTAGGLNVTAPANANLCPPGHYMLFILNDAGVPSIASVIQINTTFINANPNPIIVTDGSQFGITTLSWSSAKMVEVHINSPSGALFARSGPGTWSKTTGKWVSNGMVIYLQNISDGLPLTAANTLATTTVYLLTHTGSISASPNPIVVTDGSGLGVTTLSWTSADTKTVEVRVGSPSGPLFARSGVGAWSKTTGKWVSNGMLFCLQDASDGLPLTSANTLDTVTVNVTTGAQ